MPDSAMQHQICSAIRARKKITITTNDGKQPMTVHPHALVRIEGSVNLQYRGEPFGNKTAISLERIAELHALDATFAPDPDFTPDEGDVICSVLESRS